MSHKISVITAVYNDEEHIESSVRSILNQTFKDFEYLIIDDGSTDTTSTILQILAKEDSRIRLIHQCNSGAAMARNVGLSMATGEFIAIQDSDDLSSPDRFDKQMKIFNSYSDVGLCGTHAHFFEKINVKVLLPTYHKAIITSMLFGNPIIHSSVMMRSNVLKENNLNYNSDFIPTEDFELWLQFSKLTKLYNLQEILVKYRVHEKSLSKTKDRLQRALANKICMQSLRQFLEIEPTNNEIVLHKTILNRTSEHEYDDTAMQMWVRKILSQNTKLQTLDTLMLKSNLIKKWLSFLYYHKNTKGNYIRLSTKLRRCISLTGYYILIKLGFSRFVQF